MYQVKILNVVLEGFKCFRQRTEIELPKEGGFYFLGGKNLSEPRLGANGAGKSSLWDGIFWCLYGTSIKGDRASELVSWGDKRPYAHVQMDIDGQIWTVARIGSPEKMTIQNFHHTPDPATQADIDKLLGLTKARFAQAVLFGQGVRLFMDLTVPERGALLDEVLDLGYWERLAELAGTKAKRHELEMRDADRDVQFTSGKLEGLTPLAELQVAEAEWAAQQDARLLELCDKLEGAEQHLGTLQGEMADVKAPEPSLDFDATLRQLRADAASAERLLGGDHARKAAASQRIKFFQEHDQCPSCGQGISVDLTNGTLHELEAEIDQINASMDRMKRQAIDIKANITSTEDAERAHRNAMRTFESQQAAQGANIRNAQQEVKNLLADIDAAETAAAANPITLQIAQRTERAAALDAELAGHQERKNKAQAGLRHMDYWRQGFKRVKLFLIKRALDVLQIETAAAAGQLGLIDWTITYVTETETKSGTLKAGVQILVKAPQAPGAFSLQSGGEGQRVRLAISIGLSNMIQRMAGVDYRIEIWDEPSAWLSPEGIADLMECLHERAEDTGKQLWVIDHRVYDSTTFNAAYIMVKTDAGSHLEQLA